MKKILTFFFLIGMMMAAKAQFVIHDSVAAVDPLKIKSSWHAKVAQSDTGIVQTLWRKCPTCLQFPGGSPVTVTDSVATSTTFAVADTGWYQVQEMMIVKDTAGLVDTLLMPIWQNVYVDMKDTIPTIAYAAAGVPNQNSGSQMLTFNPGNTTATIYVYVSPGDTLYSTPVQVDMFSVSGGIQTMNYTFGNISGGVAGYKFSYKFKIQNYKGQNTTPKGAMVTTQSPGTPWIAQTAQVTNATDSSLYFSYQALTGGTAGNSVIRWRLASSSVWTDTMIVGAFPASPYSINVEGTLPNLLSDSVYERQACVITAGGSACSSIETWTVPSRPVPFKLTTPIHYYGGGNSEVIQGTAVLPKGAGTFVCVLTKATDLTYSAFANLQSSPLVQVSAPGVHTLTHTFSGLIDGETYRAMWYGSDTANGFLQIGSNGVNEQVVFTFHTPSDTVKPLADLNLQYKTSTEIGVTFSGSDNDSLAGFILSINGTATTLPATATSHIFTGRTPSTSYFITLQSFDAAGLFSTMDTLTVVTDATNATPTPAILTSIPGSFCFGSASTWKPFEIVGMNFQPGAKVVANYHDGLPNDTVAAVFNSSTSVGARIWVLAHYSNIEYTVINPGAGVSNTLTTQVIDCGSTGINEVNRNGKGDLTAYPNPFNDVIQTFMSDEEEGTYVITNMVGQQVQTGTLERGKNVIHIQSSLPQGFYTIVATGNDTHYVYTTKAIKY